MSPPELRLACLMVFLALLVSHALTWKLGYWAAEREQPQMITRNKDGSLQINRLEPGQSIQIPLEWLSDE